MDKKIIKIGEIQIPFEAVSEFFKEDATEEEITETIESAIEMYFEKMKNAKA